METHLNLRHKYHLPIRPKLAFSYNKQANMYKMSSIKDSLRVVATQKPFRPSVLTWIIALRPLHALRVILVL